MYMNHLYEASCFFTFPTNSQASFQILSALEGAVADHMHDQVGSGLDCGQAPCFIPRIVKPASSLACLL